MAMRKHRLARTLAPPIGKLTLLQPSNRILHFVEMDFGIARVGDVDNFSVEADEKADAFGHFLAIHANTVNVRDPAIRVREQSEIQIILRNELFVAVGGIEADADDFD